MKTYKIINKMIYISSLLLLAIGILILYLDPSLFVNKLIFFSSVGLFVSILLYRRMKKTSVVKHDALKDKIYFALFLVHIILGILTLLMIYLNKKIWIDISFISFVLSLIGLLIRGKFLEKRIHHD